MSFLSFSRRFSPRSTASATAIACGSVKLTVALMLMPRYVASSMACNPRACGRDLHDHVGGKGVEVLRLRGNCRGVPIEPRIRLNGEPAVPSFFPIEDRLQQLRRLQRHLLHEAPGHLSLRGACHFSDELADPVLPLVPLLFQHGEHDHRVAGRADRAVVLDRSPQLLQRAGVVPEHGRGGPGHEVQRCFVLVVAHVCGSPPCDRREALSLTARLSPG